MLNLTRPYILYSIRTNIFQQAMKNKDLLTLWGESKYFLKSYTTAEIDNPSFIKLKIYPIFDRKKLNQEIEEVLSVSERPTLEPIWTVAKENLEKLISGLHKIQHALPIKPNALELEIWYNFNFLDASTRLELPNNEYHSYIEFTFSKRHTCMPCLIFPFEDSKPEFWTYLDSIKTQLPFELDEKLLRKVYVKNGSPSSLKKIVRPN